MPDNLNQPANNLVSDQNKQSSQPNPPDMMTMAQRTAAKTSVSGRKAVSRGTILFVFYLWLLAGAAILSFIAHRTDFFPGDKAITARLQKERNPWVRRFFYTVSEIGFPKWSVPLTLGVSGIFWVLRFRLEALFILLTSSSTALNFLVKRLIKRPRPTKDLVAVARVINEPSFPSGHVMYYTNFYGLLIYLLATNWRSGRLRNILISLCTTLILVVGPSRIYLGAHWPSDVIAGYLYGGLWFGGIMTLYLRIKAWLHPPRGKAPAVVKPLQQPGDEQDSE
ncbi:MAG TPA: phosphatase PAP2 family protein [Ktedonobacteraceae bacterium]